MGSPVGTAWELAHAWPDARLVVVDDSGHTGSETMRTAILDALNEFAPLTQVQVTTPAPRWQTEATERGSWSPHRFPLFASVPTLPLSGGGPKTHRKTGSTPFDKGP